MLRYMQGSMHHTFVIYRARSEKFFVSARARERASERASAARERVRACVRVCVRLSVCACLSACERAQAGR